MARLSIAILFIAALAACSDDDPIQPDAGDGPPACDGASCVPCDGAGCQPPPVCSVLAAAGQQGCDPGEKCAWDIVQESPERLGRVACVPDGTLQLGATCTVSTVGAPDGCSAGLVCVGGTCHDVCGFDGSADAACPADFSCTNYDGQYANGNDNPLAGACNPTCNPVTQLQGDGSTCGFGNGCYILSDDVRTIAVCASAGDVGHGELLTGDIFANSCVPGAQPRRRNGTTQEAECGGLCAPAEVTSTTNMTSEGGVGANNCQTKWGAAPPSDGVAGESCRYFWALEDFDGLSPYSNTVGWCFKHAVFQYDSDGNMTDDAPFPRCIDLTTGDVVPPIGNPPHNDARFFFCAPLLAAFTGASQKPAAPPVLHVDRLQR